MTQPGHAHQAEPAQPAFGAPETSLALIERRRGRALADEQRAAVLARIQAHEDGWLAQDAFKVPDGSEPGFVFHPVLLADHEHTGGSDE